MPLPENIRELVLTYCDRDLPKDEGYLFTFIDTKELRERVQAEFAAARYIYKLGEALNASEEKLHAHVKFQIVQYAGIYEAIIVWLLWKKYPGHDAVKEIEFHSSYQKATSLPTNVSLTTKSGESLFLCTLKKEKTNPISIKFDDKVDAAIKIGFVDPGIGGEIKDFYKLRNAIHLESAIKNEVKFELKSAHLAYRRMLPFTRGVAGFLASGTLPDEARPGHHVPKRKRGLTLFRRG